MTVYTIGWILCALASAAILIGGQNSRTFAWVALIYFTTVAVLRGAVGTDTSAYEDAFARILAGNAEWISEGLFGAVGLLLCELGGSAEAGVRLLSGLFFGLLAIFCLRADRDELLLLSAYALPVFGYQYSMNTLRIGMAMAVLLLAVQAIRRTESPRNVAVLFAPVLLHYTSIIASCFLVLTGLRWKSKLFSVAVAGGVAVFAMFQLTLQDYLFGKLLAYETFAAPSEASGLSRLVIMAIITGAVLVGGLPANAKVKLVWVTAILALIFAALTKDTAAGLRLLDILSFSMPLGALLAYASTSRLVDKYFKIGLCLAGVIPAKVFEYLLTDKPILLIGPSHDCEVFRLVESSKRILPLQCLESILKGLVPMPLMAPFDNRPQARRAVNDLASQISRSVA